MTEHEQRIAIAEACGIPIYEELGIRYKDGKESWGNSPDYTAQKCSNYQRQGLGCELIKRKQTAEDFDPLNDLNAMHEAEKSLSANQWGIYRKNLAREWMTNDDDGMWAAINATARQRAEAFLRTIGKWKEDV